MSALGHEATDKRNALNVGSSETIPWKRVVLYVTISLGFFLLGVIPMWLRADTAIEQRNPYNKVASNAG